MEIISVNHQRRRCKIKAPTGLIADHIIPYCICMDDSKENIQFLTKKEHTIKTIKDFKIIKKFRSLGYIEKITNYSHDLKAPISFFKEQYKLMFKYLDNLDNLDRYSISTYGGFSYQGLAV